MEAVLAAKRSVTGWLLHVGVVAAVGERVSDIGVGDRVACGGGGFAVHAEVNYVPVNLCVRLPDAEPCETGAFTTIGSIALHAVRQAEAHIGERVAVIGLGLVGQLTCRILAAAGCNALGIDLVEDLVDLAQRGGAQAAYRRTIWTQAICQGISATATASSSPPPRIPTTQLHWPGLSHATERAW